MYGYAYIHLAYLSYLANRTDVVLGISNGLHKYSLSFLIDSRREFRGVIGSDKLDRNPVFFEKHYQNRQLKNTCGKPI